MLRTTSILLLASFVISSPVGLVNNIAILPSSTTSSIISASTFAGATSADVFPPPNVTPNTSIFPDASVVGYPGPTATGLEPFACQTAASFPQHTDIYPLVLPAPYTTSSVPSIGLPLASDVVIAFPVAASVTIGVASQATPFLMQRSFGDYCPSYSVDSGVYGLGGATPLAPATCEIIQVHYYYRHGARYPTAGEPVAAFAAKVHAQATRNGFTASGLLSFLNTWTYKLGEELLVHFGRKQNFDLGISARILYGHLLNSFTTTLPVFRTESNARMIQTAQNFAAGFFGIPTNEQYNLEIIIEANGFNNTGAPYDHCPNANLPVAEQGSAAGIIYANKVFAPAAARLNSMLTGLNITDGNEVVSLMEMCAYETVALGDSPFCTLFTQDEWYDFEYFLDLFYYYNWSFGSPTAAAQGLGFLQEFVSRLTKTPITVYNSTTNSTLDGNNVTFPLDQSFYADASHEVVILALMTALNLTSLAASGPLPLTSRPSNQTFIASQIVPFATNLVSQVLTCDGTKKIRFLVNDAVIPLTYEGCSFDKDGLCNFDTVVSALHTRIGEIDFEYDCFGNYTAPVGVDLNGRAPRN